MPALGGISAMSAALLVFVAGAAALAVTGYVIGALGFAWRRPKPEAG
jgi:hypothetical protein